MPACATRLSHSLASQVRAALVRVGCCALLAAGVHAGAQALARWVSFTGLGSVGSAAMLGWELGVDLMLIVPWPRGSKGLLSKSGAALLYLAIAACGAFAVAAVVQSSSALALRPWDATWPSRLIAVGLLCATLVGPSARWGFERGVGLWGALLLSPLAAAALKELFQLPSVFG